MEKYYFEMDAELNCKKSCEYFSIEDYDSSDTVKVGSLACKQCIHNVSYCADENWIKCEVFSAFAEVELLRKENTELRKEINLLKGDF